MANNRATMPNMALELNKLIKKVDGLGAAAAQRAHNLQQTLPVAKATLQALAADESLADKLRRATTFNWQGALPTSEPPHLTTPAPTLLPRFNLVAADGSQIQPDRHGLALYYLVNIGAIVYRQGTGDAPTCDSQPHLFYEDTDLYFDEEDNPITAERVNARRDVLEMAELARVAVTELPPTLAVIDGALRLFLSGREQNKRFIEEVRADYIAHLNTLREVDVLVAGVIDRSAAVNVLKLLNLATLELDEINQQTLNEVDKFPNLIDSGLFDFLRPGERSALFAVPIADKDPYKGHQTYFFYLNASVSNTDEPLRVEIPEWVATDKNKLDLVQAVLVEQSRYTNGYPYVLTRAHELAVVTPQDRSALDELVMQALLKRGIAPAISQKARGKTMVRTGKRRAL
jgi:hypothetical protein